MILIIYLDNAASTQITKPVLDAMLPYLTTEYGNPSSLYSLGRTVKRAIETARKQVATAINARPNEIFFLSGATEANNIIARSHDFILAHKYEHHSISHQPNFVDVDDKWTEKYIDNYMKKKICLAQMLVNNEVGTIFYDEIEKAKQYGVPVLIDATQAFSHILIDVRKLGCDYLSLSGHKFHTPRGAGILYVKDGNTKNLIGQYGGGQEQGFRAGTENTASIVAMGKAAELYNYTAESNTIMTNKKNYLISLLNKSSLDYRINSLTENNVPNILNFSVRGVEAESVLLMLDNMGICVSAGSACASGSLEPSETLKAIGIPQEYIYGTIRVSMSEFTTYEELDEFVSKLVTVVNKLNSVK